MCQLFDLLTFSVVFNDWLFYCSTLNKQSCFFVYFSWSMWGGRKLLHTTVLLLLFHSLFSMVDFCVVSRLLFVHVLRLTLFCDIIPSSSSHVGSGIVPIDGVDRIHMVIVFTTPCHIYIYILNRCMACHFRVCTCLYGVDRIHMVIVFTTLCHIYIYIFSIAVWPAISGFVPYILWWSKIKKWMNENQKKDTAAKQYML